jgi:nucleotide-binding universal stress UspA family protein
MNTILVPTDFSDLSKIAVLYAVQFAEVIKANIILLAVIHPQEQGILKSKTTEDDLVAIAARHAEQLMKEITEKGYGAVPVSYQYTIGLPIEDQIERFAVDNEVDLIVMGTKGTTGLKRVLLGSSAAAVIDNSSVPVIAVPGNAVFRKVNKIVYATDMTHLYAEAEAVVFFARLLHASISVLYVAPEGSRPEIDIKAKEETLIQRTGYADITFDVAVNNKVAEEVDTFVENEEADMLAVFTHKLDFYEKLFGKSVTRQLAFHSSVPLLAFNKTLL